MPGFGDRLNEWLVEHGKEPLDPIGTDMHNMAGEDVAKWLTDPTPGCWDMLVSLGFSMFGEAQRKMGGDWLSPLPLP